ncbi:MAG: O-antigen ligase family protein [Verrucomicrobiota bacterium]
MNNAPAILRSLIIYAVCVPLAVAVGYMLTNPMDYSTLGLFGILALVLVSPLLLRWHYPLLLFSWFSTITVFFFVGAPNLWLVMVALSLGISVLERALSDQMHFIRVPQITWPLIAMIAVVIITAEATGGVGLKAFGSAVYGGRKYIFLLVGIMSYFALTSRRIPPEKAGLYVALFFLGQTTRIIGDFYSIAPSWLHYIFYVFPPTISDEPFEVGRTRLGGVCGAATGMILWMLSRYGIRGILLSGKLWRPFLFMVFFLLVFLGGFRSSLFLVMTAFILMFFMEGLHHTRLLPAFILVGILGIATLIPFAHKLPFTFQRTLALLPLDLEPAAKQSAEDSTNWRLQMWKALLPQIPNHLLLGTGYVIPTEEYNEMMGMGATMAAATAKFDPSQSPLALYYDYHNGMLSIVLCFGIWGVIVFLWFVFAGLRVLYLNFKYGDPALRPVNSLLFALFFTEVASYVSCMAGLQLAIEIGYFTGYLGFSIALNHGVCQPAPQPVPVKEAFLRPQGALPGSQPRPAFPR